MPEYTTPRRETAALLTIDLQSDFIRTGSPVLTTGFPAAQPGIETLITAFREAGLPIYHSLRLYRPDATNVDIRRRADVEGGMRILMPGTSGVELIEEFRPEGYDFLHTDALFDGGFQDIGPREYLFYKPRWGAFHGTGLEEQLRADGVDTLIVCGCNFPTGGRATLYEACARDFRVLAVEDAFCDARKESLEELGRIGAYLKQADACADWLLSRPSAHSV